MHAPADPGRLLRHARPVAPQRRAGAGRSADGTSQNERGPVGREERVVLEDLQIDQARLDAAADPVGRGQPQQLGDPLREGPVPAAG